LEWQLFSYLAAIKMKAIGDGILLAVPDALRNIRNNKQHPEQQGSVPTAIS
jgi:hypothetical protein